MTKVDNIQVIPTLGDEELCGLVDDALHLKNEGVRKDGCRVRIAGRELAEGQIASFNEALKIVESQVMHEAARRFVKRVGESG